MSDQGSEPSNPSEEEEKPRPRAEDRIVINVGDTQYPVVREVCRNVLRWRLQQDKEAVGWDVCWTDNAVQAETLGRMSAHQKINHFPGMFTLARKNYLARGLNKLKRKFEEHYAFFPDTWLLPAEFLELKTNMESKQKGKARTYIAKPEAGCQGRGIFLTRSLSSFDPHEHYVVQRYLTRPYLIEGLKFDLRIYVLLAGCDPLRVYLYKEGLGRLATVAYEGPKLDNLGELCMHLTNYAINKENENFVFNEDENDMSVGHKRSLSSVLELLRKDGVDVPRLMAGIKDIVIKTLIVGQPVLSHHYQACQSQNLANNMCFEVLGFDIILDHKATPYLLEVNHTPSFTTDTPLDQHIKENLIRDALRLMNISVRTKTEILAQKKLEVQQRMLTGKKARLTPEQRRDEIDRLQRERNEFELRNLGGFEQIYPCEEERMQLYKEFLQFSCNCYEESTGANIKRNVKKQAEPPPLLKKPVLKPIESRPAERGQLSEKQLPEVKHKTYAPRVKPPSVLVREELSKKRLEMSMISEFKESKTEVVKEDDEPRFRLPHYLSQDRVKAKREEEQRPGPSTGPSQGSGLKTTGNFVQPKIFVPTFVCTSSKGGKGTKGPGKVELQVIVKK